MILTNDQLKGLNIAIDRFKSGYSYTCISGFAGSGKSTLVRSIIEKLCSENLITEKDVAYATFTGKAAEVLRNKGNSNAMTLHKLLYNSRPLPDGIHFAYEPVPNLNYKLIIVDEISMVPKDILNHLASYGKHVICCGDPFQIPPIDPNADNHILDNPHVFLGEIMRQAAESDIIKISMDIREGKEITSYKGKDIQILSKKDYDDTMLDWADQIIVATNKKRKEINDIMRRRLYRGEQPESGDKIICCRNYWDARSEDGNPLVNGTIGYLKNPYKTFYNLPRWISNGKIINVLSSDIVSESNDIYKNIRLDNDMIMTGIKCVEPREEYKAKKSKLYKNSIPYEFEYGYGITLHRAQGSQWNKVLIFEEPFPFNKEEHARWLYTGITRAVDKCVIIMK